MATLLAVYNSEGCVGRCDAKCYDAHEPDCDCICQSMNHGKGRQQAEDNTREHGERWLDQARAGGWQFTEFEVAPAAAHEPLFSMETPMDDRFPALPAPVQLLSSTPGWQYPRQYSGVNGRAHLRVWACEDRSLLAVVTETGEGVSVTNGAEDIWAELAKLGRPFVLLEHWPPGLGASEEEHLDQVVVKGRRPDWRRIWPTPPANPRHEEFEAWMRAHGSRLWVEG